MIDTFDVTGILLERVLQAIEALTMTVATTPAPQVTVPPVDLGEIVTAVNGLKPGVSAEEIAAAIERVLQPPSTDGEATATALQLLVDKMEQLDFRMKGSMPAFGASGPSNISDNPNRQLGHVTVDGLQIIQNGVATDQTLAQVRDGISGYEVNLDYDVRTDGLPVYVGKAPQGTAQTALTWQINKLNYDASNRLIRSEVLTGAWTNRTTLAW